MRDAVDAVLAQWAVERPDVDVSPMGLVGRISRAAAILDKSVGATLSKHQLQPGEFDILATLRRSGVPFKLTVGAILDSAMVTSGAIANRLNRLASKNLIERDVDPTDRRSVIVSLTDQGLAAVNNALPDHVVNEKECLRGLTESQQEQLVELLRHLLVGLGDGLHHTQPLEVKTDEKGVSTPVNS